MDLLVSPDASRVEAGMTRENRDRVHRAMRGLSLGQRRVVRLRVDGYSLREIAAIFGRSASGVDRAWEMAAQSLRPRLLSTRPRSVVLQLA